MSTTLRHVGLDVHKVETVIAVADGVRDEPKVHSRVSSDTATVERVLKKLGGPARLRVCYEAERPAYRDGKRFWNSARTRGIAGRNTRFRCGRMSRVSRLRIVRERRTRRTVV